MLTCRVCRKHSQISTANKQTACCPSLDATECQPQCRQVLCTVKCIKCNNLSLVNSNSQGFFCQDQDRYQDFYLKTKTKTLFFVVEAPRDQDCGLEDYITGPNSPKFSLSFDRVTLTLLGAQWLFTMKHMSVRPALYVYTGTLQCTSYTICLLYCASLYSHIRRSCCCCGSRWRLYNSCNDAFIAVYRTSRRREHVTNKTFWRSFHTQIHVIISVVVGLHMRHCDKHDVWVAFLYLHITAISELTKCDTIRYIYVRSNADGRPA